MSENKEAIKKLLKYSHLQKLNSLLNPRQAQEKSV